jgi:hypothetical protein
MIFGRPIVHRHIDRRSFLGSLGLLFASPRLRAQRTLANDPQPDASIAEAARGFLAALRPELRRLAELSFEDPKRKDWSNLPHYIHPRKGLRLGGSHAAGTSGGAPAAPSDLIERRLLQSHSHHGSR